MAACRGVDLAARPVLPSPCVGREYSGEADGGGAGAIAITCSREPGLHATAW